MTVSKSSAPHSCGYTRSSNQSSFKEKEKKNLDKELLLLLIELFQCYQISISCFRRVLVKEMLPPHEANAKVSATNQDLYVNN